MQGQRRTVGALALLAALAGPVLADDVRPPLVTTAPAGERPAMRSHQPYSGLQYGFRPEPPGQRGIRPETDTRPEIVEPTRVPPLVEFGTRRPHGSQYYRYCPRSGRCR